MRSLDFTAPLSVLQRTAAPPGSSSATPRLLLVFAHPDDEVLAIGARLERLRDSHLLTLTDGTPRDGADARHHGFPSLDAYRAARRVELGCALRDAGLPETVLVTATGVPVPDQTAVLHLGELTAAVAEAIHRFEPEAVLTHPYEGGHPDHDACAFAVHAAAARASRLGPKPTVLEAPFYHVGADGSMRTGAFLEGTTSPQTLICELSPEQVAAKRRRLACFSSQRETLAQFEVARELFRIAPDYDFTQPPHPGQLLYERFPWGMNGERFRELAARVQQPESQGGWDTPTTPA